MPAAPTRPKPSSTPRGGDYYAANPTPEMQRDMQRRAAEEKRKADEMRARADKLLGNTPRMAKGGSASKRADGCAMRGKTKGKMI